MLCSYLSHLDLQLQLLPFSALWILTQQKQAVYTFYHVVCAVNSVTSDSATLWTVARQAPLSMGFSRQEYLSGLPCPPPGDLPDSGIYLTSCVSPSLAGWFFTTSAT